MDKMKKKIAQYEIKLSSSQMVNAVKIYKNLADTEENKAFVMKKANVEAKVMEHEIMQTMHNIELQDLRKQELNLRNLLAMRLAKKSELERQLEDICDELSRKEKIKEETEKRLALKARFLQKYRAKQLEAGEKTQEELPEEFKQMEEKLKLRKEQQALNK